MQAVKPVNIYCYNEMQQETEIQRKVDYNYTLLISRAGRDNWIGEAIVAQTIHEAMHYKHHRDSISNSLNYMVIYY